MRVRATAEPATTETAAGLSHTAPLGPRRYDACDAIALDRGLAGRLLAEFSGEVKVIALKGEQWETMPALYHCSLLPEVRACMAEGRRRVMEVD